MFEQFKKVKLLLLLVFLMACSSIQTKNDINQQFRGIDPEFYPYIERFKLITDPYYDIRSLENLSMGKRKIGRDSTVGLCKIFTTNGGKEIVIDSYFWDNVSLQRRSLLAMHELGHCLCDLYHEHLNGHYEDGEDNPKGYFPDGCPVSFMYPEVPSDFCYDAHQKEYEEELKERCRISSKSSFDQKEKAR